jgi:hypothetical protein
MIKCLKKFLYLQLLLTVAVYSHAATIYKWVDADGLTHYSEEQNSENKAEVLQLESFDETTKDTDDPTSASRMQQQADEMEKARLAREQIIQDKKQTLINKREAEKFTTLIAEFGGAWVLGAELEPQCRANYDKSCEQLLNWKELAYAQCQQDRNSHDKCSNHAYLAEYYKPMTVEQQRQYGIENRVWFRSDKGLNHKRHHDKKSRDKWRDRDREKHRNHGEKDREPMNNKINVKEKRLQ